ncbi:MAG: hypothetical protein M3P23_05400 [Actinomycetota bacterium]|nr:hypothetical protein [Actinomycetota bacterium]
MTGARLDVLDFALLSIATAVLVRCRPPASVAVPAALTIAGWSSNLLDRLGLHNRTAPGSLRGAVDFVHLGGSYCNVADLFIVSTTPLLLLLTARHLVRWATDQPAANGSRISTVLLASASGTAHN